MIEEQPEKNQSKKLPKHRSPSYPFISLRKALARAREFYGAQRHHPAPLSVAVAVWDFGAKSSGGLQTISALKQFGLMTENEVNNTRQVKLTDAALRIIQDERPESAERDAEIKRLALLPKIYSEMWRNWGVPPPAEATVKFFLVNERKYNETAFADLFSAYKDTIAFAKLAESDKTPPADGRERPGTPPTPPGDTPPPGERQQMEGERIVFTHEIEPSHGVRVLASGQVDESMLDALELYIQLQKRRLERERQAAKETE